MKTPHLAATGLLILACAVAFAFAGKERSDSDSKVYTVTRIAKTSIVIDGVLNDSEWPSESWTTDFCFPWQRRESPRTRFCCVHDGRRLLFAFRCDDPDVVLKGSVPRKEFDVAEGDRVELFFAKDAKLAEYHCLEMSPAGNVLDYKATYYREFDDSWDCPGLVLAAATCQGGYIVEGAIPLTTVRGLTGSDMLDGRAIRVGVLRAEYSHDKTGKAKEEWISWVRPSAKEPDFHIPSAFGHFRLKNLQELP